MNNNFIVSTILLSVLLMSGCARNDGGSRSVRISVSPDTYPETKTQIGGVTSGGEMFMEWLPEDSIGVVGTSSFNRAFRNTVGQNTTAPVFENEMQSYDTPVYAYYPYDSDLSDIRAVKVSLPAVQTYSDEQSVAGYDIKASTSVEEISEAEYSVHFRQMVSVIRFEVSMFGVEGISINERIESLNLTSEGDPISGIFSYDLTDPVSGMDFISYDGISDNVLEVIFQNKPSLYDIVVAYAVVAPGSQQGKIWNVEIITENHRIAFSTNALLDFEAGLYYTLKLNSSVFGNNDAIIGEI